MWVGIVAAFGLIGLHVVQARRHHATATA